MSGFIRPEIRFPDLGTLVRRIKLDSSIARNMLDLPVHAHAKDSL